ncbi:AGAP009962-PA, partial [Anopheles gambiae str. PEST]
ILRRFSQYFRLDIQLQCLDAHSLLLVSKDGHRKTNNGYNDLQTDQTSTPGSSLDLEWENDYGYQHSQWYVIDLQSFPASVQESVFKIEEWSTLKRSKDRINALRKLDHQHQQPAQHQEAQGSMPPGGRAFPSLEQHHAASLTSVDRMMHGGSSDLSHISSTPEGSLEWDIDQDRQLKSENESLDYDTKELLLEIEQLKNRVLSETGATLKDDELPSS